MTITEFENLKEKKNPLILKFKADWCTPCKQLDPILQEIEQSHNIQIIEVDVEESVDFCERMNIKKLPTIQYFQNGEFIDEKKGLTTKKVIEDMIT